YCATCDGPLFTGKDVAVIGGGNSALDAALQLKSIAKKTYVININQEFTGDPVMIDKLEGAENVEVIHNAATQEISGGDFVSGIKILEEGKNMKTIPVEGVFIEVGSIPTSQLAKCEGLEFNDQNEITVNNRCETTVPGLFAAGDVTNVPEKQIIVAAAQGCIASLSAFKYLSKSKF
ncbi:MAG: thioredoxin-disulfide reductase, partial [Candidatus Altiarchaeales archaeon]|nr:thioredoxin-disulfide reductase [Candidatus Altiarchaeales archaeon]